MTSWDITSILFELKCIERGFVVRIVDDGVKSDWSEEESEEGELEEMEEELESESEEELDESDDDESDDDESDDDESDDDESDDGKSGGEKGIDDEDDPERKAFKIAYNAWVAANPITNLEIFRSLDFLGFPNYAVNGMGVVRNVKLGKGLKLTKNGSYFRVSMDKNTEIRVPRRINRLVAYAFLGFPPTENYSVDHIDRKRGNNCVSNLRWATAKDQANNRGKFAPSTAAYRVSQLNLDGSFIKTWDRTTDVSKEYDIDPSCIGSACRNGTVSAGFRWRYEFLDIPGEIWKELPVDRNTTKGAFQVSNMGRVKFFKRAPSYGTKSNDGYFVANICINGKLRYKRIHRLVIGAFLEFREEFMVNHIDGDKTNNRLDNLEYVTQQENVQHALETGLRKTVRISQYAIGGTEPIAIYESIKDASEKTGVRASNITDVARGRRNTSGGFVWIYADSVSLDNPPSTTIKRNLSKAAIRVQQWSIDGLTLINTHVSLEAASKTTGVHKGGISNASKGKYNSSGGFIWRLENSNSIDIPVIIQSTINPMASPTPSPMSTPMASLVRSNSVQVEQWTLDGSTLIQTYDSLQEAARAINVNSSNISAVLSGRQKTSGGFIWKRAA